MRQSIDAIAFDIDGTLYPNYRFNFKLIPFLLTNARFLARFGIVREEIRTRQESNPTEKAEDFFQLQAELLAKMMGISAQECKIVIEKKIYNGWKPLFLKVKPFKHAKESIEMFKNSGLKIALLSDFLPDQKGDVWGIAPLCDVVLGSEETGALKPSPIPFQSLAEALGVSPSRILYVGNSIRSDVRGASRAGMKTACIQSPLAAFFNRKVSGADISFYSYRQLLKIVLN